jgi:uncharacterized membrane protein YqaE (UPF0057 family)
MKKNLTTRIFGTLAIAGFLFSCSTSGDLTIEKRRYRNGFYVSRSSSNKTEKAEQKRVAQNDAIAPRQAHQLQSTPVQPTLEQPSAVAVNSVAVTPTSAPQQIVSANKFEKAAPAATTSFSKKEVRNAAKAILKKSQQLPNSSSKDDVDPIVIILCCIFIPPLAVYLIKGDADKDFIINLILTLLCGIPGIIHAFIVYSKNK